MVILINSLTFKPIQIIGIIAIASLLIIPIILPSIYSIIIGNRAANNQISTKHYISSLLTLAIIPSNLFLLLLELFRRFQNRFYHNEMVPVKDELSFINSILLYGILGIIISICLFLIYSVIASISYLIAQRKINIHKKFNCFHIL